MYIKNDINKISIIIPTYNAQRYLPKLLDSIKTQSIKNYELLIIDSSSSDKTVEIAKEYTENVIVIPQSEFDHGGTRAKAAQIASGEILVYLTQDALPCDDYTIESIIKVFEDEKIGAAYGRQLSYDDTNLFGKHLREFNYSKNSYIRDKSDIKQFGLKTAFLSDSFAAYRKSALQDIGLFKSDLILGEDTYAGAKMILDGYSLAYVSEAQVYHSHSYTVWQEFKRYFDIGVFHKYEDWILERFGKAEGEGKRYIKSEVKYLLKNKSWYLLPEWFVRNGMKYLGYKLGQKYEKLPKWMIKRMSMHHRWWDKKIDSKK
ncbi:MAG: O antigen biosynthesis rhamnosyltransferase rfbN (EC [uncultured Campylobacterales bacterium]|uniref:O antigen biosynthesis rhamnosyltransferase rfbN (EC) n=1 Tax=uncultured Campylobacterales bacterium TaxID=352960 RepID=A0A6S6T1B6_9BACT|nr:MAG: O antigen biosynthesis rhamnosyltransferase rfbN (EC [uncultured Campylobacterales bacterium]